MDISTFNQLSPGARYSAMNRKAVYLEVNRRIGLYKVSLFYLNGFYIELWLNVKTDQLEKAEAFSSYELLDPYLADIDLTPVYAML